MGFISKLYLHFNFSKFLVSGILFLRVNSIKTCFFWVLSNKLVYKAVFFLLSMAECADALIEH